MTKNKYTGINIQHPISQLIIKGEKTIETRTYAIPKKYLNQEMLLIETPGKKNNFISRIIGIIKFTNCFQYTTKKEFYSQELDHCVSKTSKWAWKDGEKWGWSVKVLKIISPSLEYTKKKGIQYTLNIEL